MTVDTDDNPPPLAESDVVLVHGYPRDRFAVEGFRAHGMLVDCRRLADGQVFCVPRRQDVGGWLRPEAGKKGSVT